MTLKNELLIKMHTLTYIQCLYIAIIHVVMRDEKEGRKKQARSNKQQCNMYMYVAIGIGKSIIIKGKTICS